MTTILLGTAALLGVGAATRMSLRSAARQGAKLSPMMQAIAGTNSMKGGPAGATSSKLPKAPNGQEWIMGGFQAKMDRKEAMTILGLRERDLTKAKLKEAHRRIMISNHPDRGGSPYLSTKINQARDLLEKQVR